jgi:RimJ/RimL family protein N-acetyltransferase
MSIASPLHSELVTLRPLTEADREALFNVASDPLIWEQHPQRDRYRREVFDTFFDGALESGSAYVIIDARTNDVIGSTRYYEPAPDGSYVHIGYTFFARRYWGTGMNREVKRLMLARAFEFYPTVRFQIGVDNIRSRTAVERLGARLIGEEHVHDPGVQGTLHVVYVIESSEM